MDGLLPLERSQLHSALKRCHFSVSVSHALELGSLPVQLLNPSAHALQQGDEIVTQGAVSSDFYMIDEGICEVSISYVDDETGEQVQQLLCTMGRGEHFGEMALLPGLPKPRSASVTAVTNVECLQVDRASFQHVISA